MTGDVTELTIETFAQLNDPEHIRLSVSISGEEICLRPASGEPFRMSRSSFEGITDILTRHDAAREAAKSPQSGTGTGFWNLMV